MSSLDSVSKVTRCPKCYMMVCKRIQTAAGLLIQVKHKGIMVVATQALITCPNCKTTVSVSGQNGIEEVFKQ